MPQQSDSRLDQALQRCKIYLVTEPMSQCWPATGSAQKGSTMCVSRCSGTPDLPSSSPGELTQRQVCAGGDRHPRYYARAAY